MLMQVPRVERYTEVVDRVLHLSEDRTVCCYLPIMTNLWLHFGSRLHPATSPKQELLLLVDNLGHEQIAVRNLDPELSQAAHDRLHDNAVHTASAAHAAVRELKKGAAPARSF